MRSLAVDGFPKHLVFYTADREVLRVRHVAHGARDLIALFNPPADND